MEEHGSVFLTYTIQVQKADLIKHASRDLCIYNILQLLLHSHGISSENVFVFPLLARGL